MVSSEASARSSGSKLKSQSRGRVLAATDASASYEWRRGAPTKNCSTLYVLLSVSIMGGAYPFRLATWKTWFSILKSAQADMKNRMTMRAPEEAATMNTGFDIPLTSRRVQSELGVPRCFVASCTNLSRMLSGTHSKLVYADSINLSFQIY